MAALCALATAAPLGSQPHVIHPTHPAAPRFEIPLDPDLNAAAFNRDEVPGLPAEAILAAAPPPSSSSERLFVAIAFSSATLLALAGVFLVTSRNLRTRPGRRKRLQYSSRTMAPLI